jgi:hypothetical protein
MESRMPENEKVDVWPQEAPMPENETNNVPTPAEVVEAARALLTAVEGCYGPHKTTTHAQKDAAIEAFVRIERAASDAAHGRGA